MKKYIPLFSALIILASCGSQDKKTQLEGLKKQVAELNGQIEQLEQEIRKEGGAVEEGKVMRVEVVSLSKQPFKNYIDIQGRVDADENVSVSSEMPGMITKINVKAGDEVRAGQVLAETDTRALQQGISELQNGLDLANKLYEKQKNLWDQKIGTEVQFLQAKTQKESLEKRMASMQEQLRMSKIVSPINGTVDAVDVKVGQTVAPGMPAIRVVNLSNLKVKAELAESYASKIKKGSEVLINFPDTQDSVAAKVNFSAKVINPLNRTFTVEVLLDNKKEYHPNMIAKLRINDYQSPAPVIVVPVKTIQQDEKGAPFVLVADGKKAVKKMITAGKSYRGLTEILSGLNEGDKLITVGYNGLNDGDKISF